MRRPPARSILCGVVLVVVTAAAPGAMVFAGPADVPERVLEVTVRSGRLSLRAHQAPLADVLAAIGREADVRIVLHGALDAPVTETFANLPVHEGIRRLSRWHSVVLIYDPAPGTLEGGGLAEVWVTASSDGSGQAEPAVRSAPRSDVRADGRTRRGPDGLARDLIAWKDANPETRREQMEALIREHGAYAVVDALRDAATRDPAPRVRRAAIQVLATIDSPDAIDAVRTTLRDADPGVRSEAQTALRRQSRARVSEDPRD